LHFKTQEIARRQAELEAKIRKPAEAEKYRLEVLAEANKQKTVLEAVALSEALAMKGDAESFAIEVKAKAQGSILQNFISAEKLFGKYFILKFWRHFHPKKTNIPTYINLSVWELWTALLDCKVFYINPCKLKFDQIRFYVL
jgi:hypothetical protein